MNQEIIKRIFSSIILLPMALFFIIKGSFFFNFFILICFAIASFEWHMMSKKKSYPSSDLVLTYSVKIMPILQYLVLNIIIKLFEQKFQEQEHPKEFQRLSLLLMKQHIMLLMWAIEQHYLTMTMKLN